MFFTELKLKIMSAAGLAAPSFAYPPDSQFGDLSLACFDLAKEQKKAPAVVASELAAKLNLNIEIKYCFSKIIAVGPYVNFFILPEYLASQIIKEVGQENKNYGFNNSGRGKKIMVEYANGNTHKEFHIGHLRNIFFGEAVQCLLKTNGYEAIPVSYINDFGINAAKTIWNWQNSDIYKNSEEDRGYLLGKCYAEASQLLIENPEKKEEVSQIKKDIEARRGENYKFWQETRQWSIDYFASIYKEFKVEFVHTFYESEEIDEGLKLVEQLINKGILKKSEGAIIADLSEYNLGVLPVIRSDGTALYPVADLALASKKFKTYELDESIYIVDVRQSLYFNQLFKILELAGYQKKMTHLTYDFVTLPDGMMSSRTGNVITYKELKIKVVDKLVAETRERHSEWTNEKVVETANSLALATIRFELLKVGSDKVIVFNINEALRFDGYTACYLQYGYARLKSIIRKSGLADLLMTNNQIKLDSLSEEKEKQLLLKIAKYPEIIQLALNKYNPSEMTKYLFELVQLFNDYYHEINILKAEGDIKQARLALINAVSTVLSNGFELLKINALEEM